MTLKMPSPWNRSGVFYFRLHVPQELVPLVGKKLIVRSLDTRDPKEAKLRFTTMHAAVRREWERLAAVGEVQPAHKPAKLTTKQVQGIADEIYRWLVGKHDADPGKAEEWLNAVEDDRRIVTPRSAGGRLRLGGGVGLYMPLVQQFLEERGIIVPESELFDIAAQAALAGMRTKERLARFAEKDYSDDPAEARYPRWEDVRGTLTLKSETLSVAEHFEEYAKTRAPGGRSPAKAGTTLANRRRVTPNRRPA